MKRKLHWLMIFFACMIVAVSCGKSDIRPQPTNTPTPTPAPTQTPTPKPAGFYEIADILSAFVKEQNDKSFTPFSLRQSQHDSAEQAYEFPRIIPAIFDQQGNLLFTFGAGSQALLFSRFAAASSIMLSQPSPDISAFPADMKKKILPADFDSFTGEKQKEVAVQAIEKARGAILEFGLRPDGNKDYESLIRSIGKDAPVVLEVFERKPNPEHPFPTSLPFGIQSINEINPGDIILFYGYKEGISGEFTTTPKRGYVSAVNRSLSIIAMDGSITETDYGAVAFTLKNGRMKLAGIVVGALQSQGYETEAYVLGFDRIQKFVEEKTGAALELKQVRYNESGNTALKERIIAAFSDDKYDSSFDLTDLKNPSFKEFEQWNRPFQTLVLSSDNPQKEIARMQNKAILIGRYVVMPSNGIFSVPYSASGIPPPPDAPVYRYRILWSGTTNGKEGEKQEFEEVRFIGYDSKHRVAVFERPYDTKFPIPDGIPFTIGDPDELQEGANVLYITGLTDVTIFSPDGPPLLRQTLDPAFFLGRKKEFGIFYLQGSILSGEIGSLVVALRDGNPEVVGLVSGTVYSPQSETFATALDITGILEGFNEVTCRNSLSSCLGYQKNSNTQTAQVRTSTVSSQSTQDRADIIALLKDKQADLSPILLDLLKPNVGQLAAVTKPIVIFYYDKNGKMLDFKYGSSIILSSKYVVSGSFVWPSPLIEEKDGKFTIRLDNGDLTSNKITSPVLDFADGKFVPQEMHFRLALLNSYLPPAEILNNLKDDLLRSVIIEELQVVLIDRETGFGLFARPNPNSIPVPSDPSFKVVPQKEIGTHQELIIAQNQLLPFPLEFLPIASRGTISYASSSPKFVINSFIVRDTVGAPIFVFYDGEPYLAGIVKEVNPFANIETDGFGLSISFIFEKIKQKTGLDFTDQSIPAAPLPATP